MKKISKYVILILLFVLMFTLLTGCASKGDFKDTKVKENILTWNAIEGAESYTLNIDDGEKVINDIIETSYNLTSLELTEGKHIIELTANASGNTYTTKAELTVVEDKITLDFIGFSTKIKNFFANTFTNPYVATFLIAVLPIVELRGAIPFGYLYFKQEGFTLWQAFLMGYLGSSIIVPILLLLLIPFINWLKRTKCFRKMGEWLESKFARKSQKVEEKALEKANKDGVELTEEQKEKKILWKKIIAIFTFVAIPLPFTGVWTGSAVAAFLKVKFKWSLLAILLGNLLAGGIITLISGLTGVFI